MDDPIYDKLFVLLKEHNFEEFKKIINTTDVNFDINTKDKYNNYYLTLAIAFNKIDIVKLLLEKGARVDIIDQDGHTILYNIIKFDLREILDVVLEYDKKNIGVSVVKLMDANKKLSLHYAIKMKHLYAIKKLLELSSNTNTTDEYQYNSLHFAVYSRSIEICKLIVPYIINIDMTTMYGETALHIACQLKQPEIISLLIENKCNINKQSFAQNYSPLEISIKELDTKSFDILMKANANVNLQNIYGETALHMSILVKNIYMFQEILKKNVDYNLWDIDGMLPLMIVFKNNLDNQFIEPLIEKTNFNIQNSKGKTCLHYIVEADLWKKYKPILIKKKMDISLKDETGKTAFDLVKPKERNQFIEMIIDSYVYRLKKYNDSWDLEWENKCFNNMEECRKNIKDKLLDIVSSKRKTKNDICTYKSYPVKKGKQCIEIFKMPKIIFCSFTGAIIDVLFGLLFLLQKHTIASGIINKVKYDDKKLCEKYKSMGFVINNDCVMLQFEFIWTNQQIIYIDNFIDNITKIKKRFIIVPLTIEISAGSHSNYLILDNKLKEIERFEPHGATANFDSISNIDLMDEILKTKFNSIHYKYIKPIEYLPMIGFQLLDMREQKASQIGDPNGFCAVWSIWYTDMRLTYPDIPRKKIVKNLIRTISENNLYFRNVIRNYSYNIIELRDKILAKSKMSINDWLNEQYTQKQLSDLFSNIGSITEKYN
jgi:ankyrin repeat protein